MATGAAVHFPAGGDEMVVEAGGQVTVRAGGEVDIEAGGSLKVAGVALTPSAAEYNRLAGVQPGTAAASKAAVLGATKNLDTLGLPVSGLMIGASGAEVAVDRTAAELNLLAQGVAAGYKLARGQHTTVAASDTVVTGLTTVAAVVACLDSDPGLDPLLVTASIGDQAGAPVAGSIYIKSWRATAVGDCTPIAATTFGKKVNWIAVGT